MSDKPSGCKRSAAELGEDDEEEIARLREQLAASIQRTELLAAIIQQREQIATKNKLLEHFQKTSIHALLKREGSENKKESLLTFECQVDDDTSQMMSTSHLPASTHSIDFILEPVELTEDMKVETSMLMAKLDGCGGIIQYQSEADISMYISHALDDAIKMVSLIKKICLYPLHEQSIFSQRADHMVVYDRESNLPIIAVERKKPAPGGILTQNIAGQLFDYAVSMQSLGHKAPFVVLLSVEETHVTWLNESLPQALAAGLGRIKAVSTTESLLSVERSDNALDQVDKTPLLPNLINGDSCLQAQSLLKSQAPSGSQQLMFEPDAERKFCCSTSKYNSSQLTQVLYSAILCGLQGLDRSSTK
jgi:hypothetical protein